MKSSHLNRHTRSVCSVAIATACLFTIVSAVRGDERLFTYTYEADVLPKGGLEFEQWLTHRQGREDGIFSAWDFREELEYGLTDRLTTAVYLNFRSTHSDGVPGVVDQDKFEFKGISSEWKYQLFNPQAKPVGVLLYGETTYNGQEVELEEKLVLQKNFGDRWTLALNATVEQEWEFEPSETKKELALEFTAGVSCRLSPHWAIGVEARNHREFPDFDEQQHSAYFVGPVIHYGSAKWWGTLTVLPQVHGSPATESGLQLEEHERIEVRLIAGINF